MRRVLLFNNLGAQLGELHPNDVLSMERREEINGEHSLTITTIQVLTQGMRVVYQDDRGYWREYVVTGVDENHASGKTLIGSYYCVWSLQVDLQGVTVSKMPGVQNPVSASTALDALLEGQTRWTRGTVSQMSTGGASMYDMSAWQALGVLVDNWGGEIGVSISVSSTGVAGRSVSLYSQLGEQQAKRRYDFSADVAGITRKVEDSAIYCRISPRGAGEQTDSGGYGRKIRITEVNDGKDYLEYAPMVDAAKLPDGSGYIYPTLIIENSSCKTPSELLAWAQGVLVDTLTPKVTYEIDALQAAREGVDVQGVSLGDVVQVVDRYFGGDGLRIEGRITAHVVDEINAKNISVTIGHLGENLGTKFTDMQKLVDETSARINSLTGYLATAEYVDNLINRLNQEINATGGYTYIVPGNGVLTFDVAVADPLNPVEANKVVEIKGGSIRIANTKTAQGEWEWKTVFVSGHIAADLVTAANITAGYIGSASGSFFIDLDNGVYRMPTSMTVGNKTVQNIANDAASAAETAANGYTDNKSASTLSTADQNAQALVTALDEALAQEGIIERLLNGGEGLAVDDNGHLYISGTIIKAGTIDATLIKAGILSDYAGKNYWNMVTGYLNTTYGKIGGFDITSSAIYHTLSSLTAQNLAGVYLGTDGIATSDNTRRMLIHNGLIEGYWENNKTAQIDTVVGGLRLMSPIGIDLKTPSLSVAKSSDPSASVQECQDFDKEFEVVSSISNTNNVLKFTLASMRLVHTMGLLTLGSFSVDNFMKNVEVPTKAYVDNGLSAKANSSSLATVATSGKYSDLSGRPSLATVASTGSYSDLNGKPSVPSIQLNGAAKSTANFVLDGNTLRITVS